MNLLFISAKIYPDGGATTNRHLAYAKGLVEAGHYVTFVLLFKQNRVDRVFVEDGIKFICVFPEGYDNNNYKIKRIFLYFKSVLNAKFTIIKIHQKSKIDAIILLDIFVWNQIPFIRLAKSNNIKLLHERTEYPFIKLIHERTEYPFVVFVRNLQEKINLYIYLLFVLRRFDGIYVINQALKNYFNQYLKDKVPIEIINMVVDPDRFKAVSSTTNDKSQYIAYCGVLNDEKDGVDILVEAYCNALTKGNISQDIKLMLIGDYVDETFKIKLTQIIEKQKCNNNIIFTGKVERLEMPDLLNNAAALALARPENKQSEGGFPTKLGEYLATGKPVIITEVGEIGYFLKDGKNAFVAHPGDIESFSGKIYEVFKDYPKALEIGKKGKLLISNEFNYLEQAKKLIRFIESLNSKKH